MLYILIGSFVIIILLICGSIISEKRLHERFEEEHPLGEESIFKGEYMAHWELAQFLCPQINTDLRKRGGFVSCELVIPYADGWSWCDHADSIYAPAEFFNIEFKGRVLEKGDFGHKGCCRYRVEVIEMISVKKC